MVPIEFRARHASLVSERCWSDSVGRVELAPNEESDLWTSHYIWFFTMCDGPLLDPSSRQGIDPPCSDTRSTVAVVRRVQLRQGRRNGGLKRFHSRQVRGRSLGPIALFPSSRFTPRPPKSQHSHGEQYQVVDSDQSEHQGVSGARDDSVTLSHRCFSRDQHESLSGEHLGRE